MVVTLSYLNRFSKFFHWLICSEMIPPNLTLCYPILLNMCSRNRRVQELGEQTAMQDSNCHARFSHWKL